MAKRASAPHHGTLCRACVIDAKGKIVGARSFECESGLVRTVGGNGGVD
jgi:hypothetical protein